MEKNIAGLFYGHSTKHKITKSFVDTFNTFLVEMFLYIYINIIICTVEPLKTVLPQECKPFSTKKNNNLDP